MTANPIDTNALSRLKDMIGGDVEDLTELVDDFVEAFPKQIALMHRQSAAQDWDALRISSHSTKSNARDMGAVALSALCAELELQCKRGAPIDPVAQVAGIDQAGQTAISSLKAVDLGNV